MQVGEEFGELACGYVNGDFYGVVPFAYPFDVGVVGADFAVLLVLLELPLQVVAYTVGCKGLKEPRVAQSETDESSSKRSYAVSSISSASVAACPCKSKLQR